jgi:hypothetical protein
MLEAGRTYPLSVGQEGQSFVSENIALILKFNSKAYPPLEKERAVAILEKVRDLVVSYTGLTLQEPEMFPQPTGYAHCVILLS